LGFGGGGDSLGVSAHLHTNAIGDGGSLNSTSLINDTPIFSQMVALG
tara:strand:+ start:273 stop:413 length:141 start_codon:yes stop_codon:yes gene_type:complete